MANKSDKFHVYKPNFRKYNILINVYIFLLILFILLILFFYIDRFIYYFDIALFIFLSFLFIILIIVRVTLANVMPNITIDGNSIGFKSRCETIILKKNEIKRITKRKFIRSNIYGIFLKDWRRSLDKYMKKDNKHYRFVSRLLTYITLGKRLDLSFKEAFFTDEKSRWGYINKVMKYQEENGFHIGIHCDFYKEKELLWKDMQRLAK